MKKTAVLLVNLGTPEAPTRMAVWRYLREFLSDPRVLDISWLFRMALLYGVILPVRIAKSTRAYQSIWQPEGSPLRVYTERLAKNLQTAVGEQATIYQAMRYGQPALAEVLSSLKSYERIIVLPLFPQYASATTGSIVEKIAREIQRWQVFPELVMITDFFNRPEYFTEISRKIQENLKVFSADHVVFSYHGLPIRQLPNASCRTCSHCPEITAENRFCYRAQCEATTRLIAAELSLPATFYSLAFQSRLGRLPWTGPELLATLSRLAEQGVKRVAVVCPAFVTDCLETLEEIGIRARTFWHQKTGGELYLIPGLNDHEYWVKNLLAPYLNS